MFIELTPEQYQQLRLEVLREMARTGGSKSKGTEFAHLRAKKANAAKQAKRAAEKAAQEGTTQHAG